MSSADFPDDSREYPEIVPETVADIESTLQAAELLLAFSNRDDENLAEKKVQWAAEMKRRILWTKEMKRRTMFAEENARVQKKSAKYFALKLHSNPIPKIVRRREDEDELVKRLGKTRFHKAMKAIKNRKNPISTTEIELDLMTQREAPTLLDLSLKVLAKNSDAIKSLNLVPEHLRKKLSNLVSNSGKVNKRFMQLLIRDSPYEICARNCVDLEEKDLTQILCDCDRVSLRVLILNLCGRAMTEHLMTDFLMRSPNGFPSLTTLSLQGAFSLTDNALVFISISAPKLRFINLSHCSLLTSRTVEILANNFESTLRGLNIGECQGIKPDYVFKRSLQKFRGLNYLSVTGLESVNDFVIEFVASRGSNLTDLSLDYCNDVTEEFIWTVGSYCPNLETLDISGLGELTDTSLESISVGIRSLNSLKLTNTNFSDEGVAAFLEVSGGSLNQLCLNNVQDVGQNTAISLTKFCKSLRYLDLSWCRKLKEEDLRRIISCCSSLRSLKLFGWTHVTDDFMEELSRTHVHIIGMRMTSIFANLDDSFPSVDDKFCVWTRFSDV